MLHSVLVGTLKRVGKVHLQGMQVYRGSRRKYALLLPAQVA